MKRIIIFALICYTTHLNASSKNYSLQQLGCAETVADAIEVHESHFGCLDSEAYSELYNLLFSLCSNYESRF